MGRSRGDMWRDEDDPGGGWRPGRRRSSQAEYGSPEDNFRFVDGYWSVYFKKKVPLTYAPMMLATVKLMPKTAYVVPSWLHHGQFSPEAFLA